ncbi:DNA-directed RNA polymerase sigma-70 factor [Rhizocola hellebori]|uniref:DNA-directed RNA polymerase sigma-70 factor n=1 Tax=Rhizocola hellebori TaxID=1392758 RepID=A0A8J3VKM8_9ACTN|nr:SigE family RNA polymerase sigma factor [Rhizocola hellebori]GIH09702.1 DNA-directed RNA polymerase sigma-70 factor [Rhizocola hellebori]
MEDDDFGEFLQARIARLSRIAFLLTGDHHAAEDLLQASLEKVAQHWKRIRRSGAPDAYVRRVLYHEHVSIWRKTRLETATDSIPEPAPSADEAEDVVRRVVLQRALSRLTPRQRAVVVLRFFEDLPVSDAAQVLGCSEGTVKSQTSLALTRLRQLAPELDDFSREGVLT